MLLAQWLCGEKLNPGISSTATRRLTNFQPRPNDPSSTMVCTYLRLLAQSQRPYRALRCRYRLPLPLCRCLYAARACYRCCLSTAGAVQVPDEAGAFARGCVMVASAAPPAASRPQAASCVPASGLTPRSRLSRRLTLSPGKGHGGARRPGTVRVARALRGVALHTDLAASAHAACPSRVCCLRAARTLRGAVC